jgi:hypothetical protein
MNGLFAVLAPFQNDDDICRCSLLLCRNRKIDFVLVRLTRLGLSSSTRIIGIGKISQKSKS